MEEYAEYTGGIKWEEPSFVICPHCKMQNSDAFITTGGITIPCEYCEERFFVKKNVKTTYTSTKVPCNKGDHKFEPAKCFMNFADPDAFGFKKLPESEWTYFRVEVCDKCDKKIQIPITKEQYKIEFKNLND